MWTISNDSEWKRGSCCWPLFITASLGVTSGSDLQADSIAIGSYADVLPLDF